MSGYPTLVEFVFRFFTHRKRTGAAGEQRNVASSDVSADLGGAQPVCRLLDNSEDIADSYSRPCDGRTSRVGVGAQSQGGSVSPALPTSPSSDSKNVRQAGGVAPVLLPSTSAASSQRAGNLRQKEKQIIATPAPESNLLTFTCDTTNETFCGEFVCEEPALGICKHCNQFVCKRCLKSGYCYVADHHEVSLQ